MLAAGALTAGVSGPLAAQDAETVGDPESERVVLLVVIGFVALGVVLLAVTAWFWRSTKPEPVALAPLEVMGVRRFTELSAWEQQERLDAVRPPGAQPERRRQPQPVEEHRPSESAVDLQQLVRETPTSFEDLIDPLLVAATPEPSTTQPSTPEMPTSDTELPTFDAELPTSDADVSLPPPDAPAAPDAATVAPPASEEGTLPPPSGAVEGETVDQSTV